MTLIQLAAMCAGEKHRYYQDHESPMKKPELRKQLARALWFCDHLYAELKKLAEAERKRNSLPSNHCACVFNSEYPEDGALSTCYYHQTAMDTAMFELEADHRNELEALAEDLHSHYKSVN